MRIFLIAGEASGDLHGAELVRALRCHHDGLQLQGWGGEMMASQGVEVLKNYRELAFMGFWEVITHLPAIYQNFQLCRRQITSYRPDAIVLIDYPGFNLRMAAWAKAQGYRVFYYIAPQVWAWHSSRVKQIRRYVDQLYAILPFEEFFFRQHGVGVSYVGHPLLDIVSRFVPAADFLSRQGLEEGKIIALLPGSRRQEISRMLPEMLTLTDDFPDAQWVIAGAAALPAAFYEELLDKQAAGRRIKLIMGQTYELLAHASAAVVCSGTATLETALFGVPQVVGYRAAALSYHIARRIVDVPYISLVNLIADKPLVEELIQHDFNRQRLVEQLHWLLSDTGRADMLAGYEALKSKLGNAGAADRAAASIISHVAGGQ
jgi:lipid-A-disaccharide synthase